MITAVIRAAIAHRGLVAVLALLLLGAGVYALRATPVDVIPDLSDPQVIVRAPWPGQAPQVIERQVTYPLTTALMAVPGAHAVRGFSMVGDAFITVLFEEGTDPYWARARVAEALGQTAGRLPDGVRAELGPDASGVGWIYKYVLVDRSGGTDLAELRALQDWFLRFELQAVAGVSEVATLGGQVRAYQVVPDPNRLRALGLDLGRLRSVLEAGNGESGGSLVELAEAEYLVRADGWLQSLDDLRALPTGLVADGAPVLLGDVAEIRRGPVARRGVVDLDGAGEVVGGIVVMRTGENARAVIERIEAKLEDLAASLPDGVEIITTYDRSGLIDASVATLWTKLVAELAVVVLIIGVFLWHLRSSLVVLVSLPLGVLAAILVMWAQGINANIMSLGGIAISIGVMVDAAIVLIENAHRHLERAGPGLSEGERWALVERASVEVGRPIFFTLLLVALSFLPVFALQAQEGRLFAPLAFTKTYAMAAAAGLAVTLVPVLAGTFIRGQLRSRDANPVDRALRTLYRPLATFAVRRPWIVLLAGIALGLSALLPYARIGSEFMPTLDEGSLLYMPTTLPGLSPNKARELLQQTDRIIAEHPEVERVMGKIGRAETATDPAPLTMIESFITLKPRDQWRAGVTTDAIRRELDGMLDFPGLSNAFVFPIQTRIDMLQTGIQTDVGFLVTGEDLAVIQRLTERIAEVAKTLPGTASAYAERPAGGRYISLSLDRPALARYGLSVAAVHEVVRFGIGGAAVTETVEGLERYPVTLRFPADWRDSPQKLEALPLRTPSGATVTLDQVARIAVVDGPARIRSENTRPAGLVLVEVEGDDLGDWVRRARTAVRGEVDFPPGYTFSLRGQYAYLERAAERLRLMVPVTLAIIVVLLMLTFQRLADVVLVLLVAPLSVAGGLWLMWLLDYELSVGVGVGFIALAGLATEVCVLMVVYLNQAREEQANGAMPLDEAIVEGAVRRVRPITMTQAAVFLGLLPVMLTSGAGSEVMQRIAAPMIGGVLAVWLSALLVLPAAYRLWYGRSTAAARDAKPSS